VLGATLLGPAATVFSRGTELSDNRDPADTPAEAGAEQRKQDGELKALRRLAAGLRAAFPQLPLWLSGDGLAGCGGGFQIAQDHRCDFVYTFQPGRRPALWQESQALLALGPGQRAELTTPAGVRHVYRWVNGLPYTDSRGRAWLLNATLCQGVAKEGKASTWSWLTKLKVGRATVAEVATTGGRHRWHIENQGFNIQNNSGLNLEHAYSHGPPWAAYSFLSQVAPLILQLVEKGSLWSQRARQQGKRTAVELFGSLKDMAQRSLESLR
jgi:hypothetical protein